MDHSKILCVYNVVLHGTWTRDHDGGGKKHDNPNCYRGRCSENLHEGVGAITEHQLFLDYFKCKF